MKSILTPFLTLALVVAVGLLVLQERQHRKVTERKDQTLALIQSRYDALLRETQTAQRSGTNRKLALAAQTQAKTLAPRYAALNKITGYTKKTAPR